MPTTAQPVDANHAMGANQPKYAFRCRPPRASSLRIPALLQGTLMLVQDRYCTLMPQDEWCETELDSLDWLILRAIGSCHREQSTGFRVSIRRSGIPYQLTVR